MERQSHAHQPVDLFPDFRFLPGKSDRHADGPKTFEGGTCESCRDEEPAFLNNVSAFLTGTLLPELGNSLQMPADSPGLLLEALAGPVGRLVFLFNGAPLVQDAHAEQLQHIKSVIGLQHVAAIADLLQAVQLVRNLQTSRERQTDWLRALAAAIRKLPAPALAATTSQTKVPSPAVAVRKLPTLQFRQRQLLKTRHRRHRRTHTRTLRENWKSVGPAEPRRLPRRIGSRQS